MMQKPSLPNCDSPLTPSRGRRMRGMTIVELMVALTVTLGIMGAGLILALASRAVLDADRHRTDVNQNLRSGMDVLAIDVRQAGERLPGDVPAVEIQDGQQGAPDVFVVRRNLLPEVLPLCTDIVAGTVANQVTVAVTGGVVPPGCDPVQDLNTDGWPDNLEAWRTHRTSNGGVVLAYLYNPAMRTGEFFPYDREDNATFALFRQDGEPWLNDYSVADQARVYILEERAYQLSGGLLRYVVNGDAANWIGVVDKVQDFQLRAFMQDGSVQPTLAPNDRWSDLESIEVTLVGSSQYRERTVESRLVTRLLPRNILSL